MARFDGIRLATKTIIRYNGMIDRVYNGRHHKIYCTFGNTKSIFTIPCTPSDCRSIKNINAVIKRAAVFAGVYER